MKMKAHHVLLACLIAVVSITRLSEASKENSSPQKEAIPASPQKKHFFNDETHFETKERHSANDKRRLKIDERHLANDERNLANDERFIRRRRRKRESGKYRVALQFATGTGHSKYKYPAHVDISKVSNHFETRLRSMDEKLAVLKARLAEIYEKAGNKTAAQDSQETTVAPKTGKIIVGAKRDGKQS